MATYVTEKEGKTYQNEHAYLIRQSDGLFRVGSSSLSSYKIIMFMKTIYNTVISTHKKKKAGNYRQEEGDLGSEYWIKDLLFTRLLVKDLDYAKKMFALYAEIGEDMESGDLYEKIQKIREIQKEIEIGKNNGSIEQADIPDMYSVNIKDARYYPENNNHPDILIAGDNLRKKVSESNRESYVKHEKAHREDAKRVADELDKELFAVEESMKELMRLNQYTMEQHDENVKEMGSILKNCSVDDDMDDNNTSLSDRIVESLEKKYRDPMIYDEDKDFDYEDFYERHPEFVKSARNWDRNEIEGWLNPDVREFDENDEDISSGLEDTFESRVWRAISQKEIEVSNPKAWLPRVERPSLRHLRDKTRRRNKNAKSRIFSCFK